MMNWEMIGVIALLVTMMNAVFYWAIGMMIRAAIEDNNRVLISQINGTYVRRKEQDLVEKFLLDSINRKLDAAECVHRREGPISH